MPRVLITGVLGFLARHLVQSLRAGTSAYIYGADVKTNRPRDVLLDAYSRVDLTQQAQVDDLVRLSKPDLVFHLAGLSQGSVQKIFAVNFSGSINLLEAVRRFSPEARVLLAGSAAEYGLVSRGLQPVMEDVPCHPAGAYGVTKYAMTLAGTHYARRYGLHVVVARYFNLIGAGVPKSLVVGAFLYRVKRAFGARRKKVVIEMGDLSAKRDFLAARDAAEGSIELILTASAGEIVNLCSGVPVSIRHVIQSLCAFSPRPIRVDIRRRASRSSGVQVMYGSNEKAKRICGFAPSVALEAALRDAWDEVMSRGAP